MKRKQKGEVVLAAAIAYMVAGFLVIVTNGGQRPLNTKAAEAPAPTVQVAQVCNNYNGGFCK